MTIPGPSRTLTVALLGNPNTGKSTLFTALVGIHQHVGNYPGVTVEKKTGPMLLETGGSPVCVGSPSCCSGESCPSRVPRADQWCEVVDLPGIYSLVPRSRDEAVAVELLTGAVKGQPAVDAVICVADASNLKRNLYLLSQLLELGLPTVLALNMADVAARRGVGIDVHRLEQRLGIPVVAIQANRAVGIPQLKAALARAIDSPARSQISVLPDTMEQLAAGSESPLASGRAPRALEPTARHEWASRILDGVLTAAGDGRPTLTDRIDRVLTHRVWGTLIFAALMVVVFQAVFSWASPLMQGIDAGFGLLGAWVHAHMVPGALRSLMVDGVLAGVGGIIAFLPQIVVLFLFIALLEDCGYMARAAFLMDHLMVRVGLSGKSFIPMLSCFACAVPGIMATRVIEDPRDRLTTILVSPLMTCSARLPVYALLIAAFIPRHSYLGGLLNLQGLTLLGLYVLGIVPAVVVAMTLKRT